MFTSGIFFNPSQFWKRRQGLEESYWPIHWKKGGQDTRHTMPQPNVPYVNRPACGGLGQLYGNNAHVYIFRSLYHTTQFFKHNKQILSPLMFIKAIPKLLGLSTDLGCEVSMDHHFQHLSALYFLIHHRGGLLSGQHGSEIDRQQAVSDC